MKLKTKKKISFMARMIGNLMLLISLVTGNIYIISGMILITTINAVIIGSILGSIKEKQLFDRVSEAFGIRAKGLRESYWT